MERWRISRVRISGKVVSEYYPRSFSELIRGKPLKVESRKLVSINDNRLKDGTPIGKCEYFWITGGLKEVHYYNKDGKVDGPYESYYENGQLWEKGNLNNEKLDGLIERFHKNGQLKLKVTYKNGKLDGLHEEFYENGQLRGKTIYKNDLIEGTSEDYFDNGQLHSKIRYKGDTEVDVETYYKNGQLEKKYKNKNDEHHGSYKSFYKNGNPKRKLNYYYGEEKGLQETYYKNGKIHIRGMVKRGGELHGKFYSNLIDENWESFNRKGKKIGESPNKQMLEGFFDSDYDKSENGNVEWLKTHSDFKRF